MRSVKFVQFAVGFAVAGGAVVLLGSSAFAADSGSSTVPQPTNSHYPQQVAPANSTGQNAAGNDQQQPGGSAQSKPPADGKGPDNSATVTQPGNSGPNSNLGQSGTSSGDTVTSSASNSVIASPGQGSGPASPSADTSQASHSNVTPGSGSPNSGLSLPQASVSQPMARMVFFRSAALVVQPTIVNHEPQDNGIASTVPSAPDPAHVPVPAKSNGALGSFADVLAGTVVPQLFMPMLVPADRIKLLLSLVTLVVLLGSLVILSYGLWLRRGGYATAARSDSPVIGTISPFATPLLMGYASAPPRSHSPSFVVSDYKSKALFPTLSERRRSI